MLAFEFRIAIDKNSSCSFQLFICKFSNKQNSKSTYSLRNPPTIADSAYKICGFHLHLRIPLIFCGIQLELRNPEHLAIFACCRVRGLKNVPTKFTLHVFVRGIHESFVSGIHLHFGTCSKVCLWNLGTYIQESKIVRISSAQFGLIMRL